MSLLTTVALLVLTALASGWDLVHQRIPNKLTIGAFVVALALAFAADGLNGLGRSVAGALTGAAIFLPLYAMGGMGAGDVKLMAAAGAFLGPTGALFASVLGLVAGAVMAVLVVVFRVLEPQSELSKGRQGGVPAAWRAAAAVAIVRKQRFPYAVAISAGIAAVLWINGSLGTFLTMLLQS